MPRILEIAQKEPDCIWVKLPKVKDINAECYYIFTTEEVQDVKRRAIRDFCFALADSYIEENLADAQT